jgi:hypothetical protein
MNNSSLSFYLTNSNIKKNHETNIFHEYIKKKTKGKYLNYKIKSTSNLQKLTSKFDERIQHSTMIS